MATSLFSSRKKNDERAVSAEKRQETNKEDITYHVMRYFMTKSVCADSTSRIGDGEHVFLSRARNSHSTNSSFDVNKH